MAFLIEFAGNFPFIYLGIIVFASLVVMILSSDKLLFGITRWAKHLGLSDYLIGMIIVAIAASLPELASAVMGIGDIGVVFGTIIGSNLGGLTLILGAMGFMSRRTKLSSKLFTGSKIFILLITALPFLFIIDGVLGRFESFLLIMSYIVYLIFIWTKEGKLGKIKKDVKIHNIWKSGLIFVLSLAALLLSARWLIVAAGQFSFLLNIPKFVVIVFVIGIGAQVPDLIVVIRSRLKHHGDVGLGDILGSTIVKALLFLGIIGMIKPLSIYDVELTQQPLVFNSLILSAGFFMASMVMLMIFMHRGYMKRSEAVGMFIMYFVYAGVQIWIL